MFSQSFGSFHNSKQFSCFPRSLSLKNMSWTHLATRNCFGCGARWWRYGPAWIVRLIRASGRLKIRQLCWRCAACSISMFGYSKRCITIVSVKIASCLVVKSGYATGNSWDTSSCPTQFVQIALPTALLVAPGAAAASWVRSKRYADAKTCWQTARSDSDSPFFWLFLDIFGQFWFLFALLGKGLGMDWDGYWHLEKTTGKTLAEVAACASDS